MAYRLSKAFGAEPLFWLNLQTLYDLAQVRERAEQLEIRPLCDAPQGLKPRGFSVD